MSSMENFYLVACLVATVWSTPVQQTQSNSVGSSLKPSQWLAPAELELLPSVEDITLQTLESLPLEDGAKLVHQLYHLTQMNDVFLSSFLPSPSSIPVYFFKPNGQKESANLNTLVSTAEQMGHFGDVEVTVFITGLPQTSKAVEMTTRKLVQAYAERYSQQLLQPKDEIYALDDKSRPSSAEGLNEWKEKEPSAGNLVVIDLGSSVMDFKHLAILDVENTGIMLGKVLLQLSHVCGVPHEIIHVVAQGIAAHVAGVAGDQFTRLTGQQLRRITALDPSKVFARVPQTFVGLSRGDAQFVDAIHTSAYGLGTPSPVGNIDFYPNGPSAGVPGAENVVEASLLATCYFAESVRPGNELNFPAVEANSLEEYKDHKGFGIRTYMGLHTDFDLQGNYMLLVNPKTPYGQRTPAPKQKTFNHDLEQLLSEQTNAE